MRAGHGALRGTVLIIAVAPQPRIRRRLFGLLVVLLTLTCAAGSVGAAQGATVTSTTSPKTVTTTVDPNALTNPPETNVPPPGHRLTAHEAQAIADRVPKIKQTRHDHRGSYSSVFLKGTDRWQVSYFDRSKPPREIGQVIIADANSKVLEAWTGPQVAWTMARGYPGAFGRKINDPIVWIPLMVLFVIPFINRRRLFCMRHLDLLALSGFSLSLMFFNEGNINASVPLVYPLLTYLLGRMLWIGLHRKPTKADREPLRLLVPNAWLIIGIIFLVGFRIGLNIVDSNVIDVGYAGVIGADRLTHGKPMYGGWPSDNDHGDTYGPVVYAAYVPLEAVWPWNGHWNDLPAAHAASILFDLMCLALLWWLGRRIRGPTLGLALAYAWATFPFTLYALNTNSNDSFVAALVLACLAVASSPPARGAMGALAGMAKFAPLALAPVLATYDPSGRTRPKRVAVFSLAFAAVVAVCLWPVLAHDTLTQLYERTLKYQANRGSPFSVWGLYGETGLEKVMEGLGVALAIALAFVPRRRDLVGLAALCAAVLIGLQLGVNHWFYLYIPWFFPLVMIALLGRHPVRAPDDEPSAVTAPTDAAPHQSTSPIAAPSPG